MPMYSAVCKKCGKEETYFRKIADRNDTPVCCEEHMDKALDAPFVPIEYNSFVSPIDGKVINNRTEFYEHLKKHKVRPTSDYEGMKPPEPAKVDWKKALNENFK